MCTNHAYCFPKETHLNETEHTKLGRLFKHGFKHVYSSSHKSGNKRGVTIQVNNALTYEHTLEGKKTGKGGMC